MVLTRDDLLIDVSQKDGYVTEEDNYLTVVLDTNLTDALIAEGFARELISKVPNMRKDAGFEVTDRIQVRCVCGDRLAAAMEQGREMILRGVLANSLELAAPEADWVTREWDINGEKATVAIRK